MVPVTPFRTAIDVKALPFAAPSASTCTVVFAPSPTSRMKAASCPALKPVSMLPTARTSPLPKSVITSTPSMPSNTKRSAPIPPDRVSLPAPPRMTSLPTLPKMVSAPASPFRMSLPELPNS